jgi:hypothetical protein
MPAALYASGALRDRNAYRRPIQTWHPTVYPMDKVTGLVKGESLHERIGGRWIDCAPQSGKPVDATFQFVTCVVIRVGIHPIALLIYRSGAPSRCWLAEHPDQPGCSPTATMTGCIARTNVAVSLE